MTTVTLIETRSVKLPRHCGSCHNSTFDRTQITKGLHLSKPHVRKAIPTQRNIDLAAHGISLSQRYDLIENTRPHPESRPEGTQSLPSRQIYGDVDADQLPFRETNESENSRLTVIGLRPQSLTTLPVTPEENYYSKTFENTRKADSELCDYVNHTEEITPVPAPTSPPPTHHRSTLLLNRASPGVPFTSPCPESEFSIDGHGIEHLEFVGSPTHGLVEIHNVRSNVNSPRLNDRRNCSSRYRPFSSASKCGDLAPRDSLNCYTQRKDAYNSDTALEYSISGLSWNRDVSLGLSDADQVLQKDGTHQYHGSGRPCGVSTSHDACATGHSSSHPFNDMPLRRGERDSISTFSDYNLNGLNGGAVQQAEFLSAKEETWKMQEIIAEAKKKGMLLDPWPFIEDQSRSQGLPQRYTCDEFGYKWRDAHRPEQAPIPKLSYTYRVPETDLPVQDQSLVDEEYDRKDSGAVHEVFDTKCEEEFLKEHSRREKKARHRSIFPDVLIPKGASLCYTAMVDKRYNKWRRRKWRKGKNSYTESKLSESSSSEDSSSDEKEDNDRTTPSTHGMQNSGHLPKLKKESTFVTIESDKGQGQVPGNEHRIENVPICSPHKGSKDLFMPNEKMSSSTPCDMYQNMALSEERTTNKVSCDVYQNMAVSEEKATNTPNRSRDMYRNGTRFENSMEEIPDSRASMHSNDSLSHMHSDMDQQKAGAAAVPGSRADLGSRYWPHVLTTTERQDTDCLVHWQQRLSPRGTQLQTMQQRRRRIPTALKRVSSNWRDLATDNGINTSINQDQEGPLRLELGFTSESIRPTSKCSKSQAKANQVRVRTMMMLSRKKDHLSSLTASMPNKSTGCVLKTESSDLLKSNNNSSLNELLKANLIVNHHDPLAGINETDIEDGLPENSPAETIAPRKTLKPVQARKKKLSLNDNDRIKEWRDSNVTPTILTIAAREPFTGSYLGSVSPKLSRQHSFNGKNEGSCKGLHSMVLAHRMGRSISSLSFTPAFTYSMFQLPDIYKWYNKKIQKKISR